jgi:phage major head subunit gpT-like protein
MLINKENIGQVFRNLLTIYNKAFDAEPAAWQGVAMLVPSTTKVNDYSWLSNWPRMRRWIGEKLAKKLAAFKYSIVNEDWEATVEVLRNDIEDDTVGIYGPQAQSAGQSAKQLPDEIVAELINGVFTNVCFDGQYFCDTDHPVSDGSGGIISVSNKLAVDLSAASQAAAIASIGLAAEMQMSFKDDEGRPLNCIPDTLNVGPHLFAIANALYVNDNLGDGTPNLYKGMFKPRLDARLTNPKHWHLLCTTKAIKPFIYQERKKPTFVSQTDMNADDVFSRAIYKFGAEARAAGGYAFWQLCVGSTGTP